MDDTTPLEPKDAEIDSLWEGQKLTVPQLVQRRAIARAVLAKWGAQPVPAGYALVPVEPTQEMLDAVRGRWSSPSACYRAILAAAPITPTSAEGPNPALKETP